MTLVVCGVGCGCAAPESLTQRVEQIVWFCGARLAAAQPLGAIMPVDGVAAPESLARGVEDVRVCGAGLAAMQPPGMIFAG